jgi:hypothetical protein
MPDKLHFHSKLEFRKLSIQLAVDFYVDGGRINEPNPAKAMPRHVSFGNRLVNKLADM